MPRKSDEPRTVIHPRAVEDLLTITRYISEENEQAAARVAEAITTTWDLIHRNPGIAPAFSTTNPKLAGIRRRVVSAYPNYSVCYRNDGSTALVLRVLHNKRNAIRLLLEP